MTEENEPEAGDLIFMREVDQYGNAGPATLHLYNSNCYWEEVPMVYTHEFVTGHYDSSEEAQAVYRKRQEDEKLYLARADRATAP